MNKTVKAVFLIVGFILICYGIYTLILPEASVKVGGITVEAQDNTNAIITIALGLVSVVLSILASRKDSGYQ